MLRRVLGENIELTLDESTGDSWVKADAGMMEQVVMNLCINARDAMAEGGRLTIGASVVELDEAAANANPKARPGRFVNLSVRDTGCGMNQIVLGRIFEPFYTTKEAGKGTGLGLATVYGIVKQHEGWIDVESTVGVGSTFRVFLPASEKPSASGSVSKETDYKRGGSETILLVEDEASLRQLAVLWLRQLGYTVMEAGTGLEAVALWEQHQAGIKLLLTDMVLPAGITGLDLAEKFKKHRPALQVIISSGYQPELTTRSGGIGPADLEYLPKPYDAKSLTKIVRLCLDRASSRIPVR
jgi:CheY-like chemotaxis protein